MTYYTPRFGDAVVATPPKPGTTWMQAILALLFSGYPLFAANPSINAPWFDTKFDDMNQIVGHLEAKFGRRHVKTHTSLDGMPIWDELRYITVYRHPVGAHFSARMQGSGEPLRRAAARIKFP